MTEKYRHHLKEKKTQNKISTELQEYDMVLYTFLCKNDDGEKNLRYIQRLNSIE